MKRGNKTSAKAVAGRLVRKGERRIVTVPAFVRALCTAVLFLLAGLPPNAEAAIRTWTAATSGYWTNAANWSGGAVPGSTDDVVFAASGNSSCTIDCDVVISSLNITNGYTKTLYLGWPAWRAT